MRILFNAIAKFISQGIASFADNFASRSNTTGGLGTSTSGHEWTPINGSINVQSGAAKAGSTPTYSSGGSAYPMSVVTMADSNVNIKLKGTNQGSSAAIWVQDSDEWWGIVSRAVQNSTPGNTNYAQQGPSVGNYYYTYVATDNTYLGVDSNTTTNYGTGSSSHTNYVYNSSSHTNYVTNYTKVAYFVYGFSASTSYAVGSYKVSYSANYGSKYNSKYAIAYNKYTWATYSANYTSSTNYSYKVNATYYAYNSDTSASGTTTNYGTGVGNNTTNYFYNSSSTTNYYYKWIPDTAYSYDYTANYFYYYGASGTNATTYAFSQYLEIIQSTASAVNTISSALVSTVSTIGSILVSLSNNQITAKAYSDTNLVTQIGSDLVYTATGAVIGTQFGITIAPSQYNQSDIIGTAVEIDVV